MQNEANSGMKVLKVKINNFKKKIKITFFKATKSLVNGIYPNDLVCLDCSGELRTANEKYLSICDVCSNDLPFRKGRHCKFCGAYIIESDGSDCQDCKRLAPHFSQVLAPFEYKGVIEKIIYEYKKAGKTFLYLYFARYITDFFKNSNVNVDFVTSVPMMKKQIMKNGFDHLKPITDYFENETRIPQISPLCRTMDQPERKTDLDRFTQYENVYGVFSMAPGFNIDIIKDKTIVIIDDVVVTGATENACARVLKENGAANVIVLSLARV
ncbi:MAG: double zinc ribbon domain-containing protein [Christensenellaceae bacterium]|jgi:ComF family protein|nr:double zinc ribbon domain-containing protein [Christensenellaceae bacterium]